jgi:hypothetical protein
LISFLSGSAMALVHKASEQTSIYHIYLSFLLEMLIRFSRSASLHDMAKVINIEGQDP